MAGSDHQRNTTFQFAGAKLNMFQSPLQQSNDDHDGHHASGPKQHPEKGDEDEDALIQFDKRESASTSELFYDLWFVANLTVFATVHEITEKATLVTFIGYFLLLWNTWFITTVYDARFPQDGIIPRIARACHLSVMIGFAIAGAAFEKEDLKRSIIKELSLFLAFSRLVLTAQYSLILYHARKNKRGRKVIMVAVAMHLVCAIVYLVIGILSNTREHQRYIIVWYTVGLSELLSVIIHATLSKTLSFEGTHFNERLQLLTLIVLGEGVIILTKNASKIVQYTYVKGIATHWSPALIGILFSAGALLYITYQLYFDWMNHHHMPAWRHALWTFLHLPFHAVLVLLAEGSTQWAVWWRAIEAYREAESGLLETLEDTIADPEAASNTSSAVAYALREKAFYIMKKYGTDWEDGSRNTHDIDAKFDVFRSFPDDFWTNNINNSSDPNYEAWAENFIDVSGAIINSISKAFGLTTEKKEESKREEASHSTTSWDEAEISAIHSTGRRLNTIFIYLFLSAGIVLMLLMTMHILAKHKGWSKFNIGRTGLIFVIGIALCLLATIQTNPQLMGRFVTSPWQLPVITIAYFCVLVMTHVPHPSQISFKRRSTGETEMDTLPLREGSGALKNDGVDGGHHNSNAYRDTAYRGAIEREESQPLRETMYPASTRGLGSIQEAPRNVHIDQSPR